MAWVIIVVAGCLEIGWAFAMKMSNGMTSFWPSVVTMALVLLSLYLLNISMKTLPVGTAYGVWAGIGTTGTALVGIIFLGESAAAPRLICLALIAIGIVGLRVLSPAP